MPSPLIIPGVQVTTIFEPSPALPSPTGILGVVGVADRGPLEPTPVGSMAAFTDTFGPGSRYTMPEVRTAFANGVSEVVVARTEPRGQKASLTLIDDEGEPVARLFARAEGTWGNHLAARVTQVRTLSGAGVKYVNLDVLLDGEVIESFNNLVMDEASPHYFFDRINEGSRVAVAVDPLFEAGLPEALVRTDFADEDARAAAATLKAGSADVIRVEAKRPGAAGNQTSVRVREGRAARLLSAADASPSIEIRAREAGADGTALRVSVTSAPDNEVNLVVTVPPATAQSFGPFGTVNEIVDAFAKHPAVEVVKRGETLPALQITAQPLERRVDIEVAREGRDPAIYQGLASLQSIAATADPLVAFSIVAAATQLPDASAGVALQGGRNKGPALPLIGDTAQPLLELVPAQRAPAGLGVAVARGTSTLDGATAVVNLSVFVGESAEESFANLTMDPDDERYLPAVLESSTLVRALDLFVRSRMTSLPRNMARPAAFTNGTSPLVDDYLSALDRLESAEQVDLVIASAANQLPEADVIAVQQAVIAHCEKMATVARNRIGLGSITASENNSLPQALSHADDVRSDYFVLAAPAGAEAALAGLLSRQDYFQSPTFKTVASLGVPPGQYTDPQLRQLINANILAINKKRGLGIIVMKGLLTSGRQINVQRTANKAVRDVKAICDKYIGLLNNQGARTALKQQITALFLQMERDGAIVPSTDGTQPSFAVDVYSSQADFANGIVRVDIAMRPVRAIDFIYATILVQN
jgi:hypothetical protein